jgi:hypothetical protein
MTLPAELLDSFGDDPHREPVPAPLHKLASVRVADDVGVGPVGVLRYLLARRRLGEGVALALSEAGKASDPSSVLPLP